MPPGLKTETDAAGTGLSMAQITTISQPEMAMEPRELQLQQGLLPLALVLGLVIGYSIICM